MTDVDPAEIRRRFGYRLASLRNILGWSQERPSLEGGVARRYRGGVERGHHDIALVNICRLADTLGVKPYALLDFDGELQFANAATSSSGQP